jgi:hypothetical protein
MAVRVMLPEVSEERCCEKGVETIARTRMMQAPMFVPPSFGNAKGKEQSVRAHMFLLYAA